MRKALKILKWVGITLGGLIGVIIIAAVVLYFIGSSKVNKTYNVEVVGLRCLRTTRQSSAGATLWRR